MKEYDRTILDNLFEALKRGRLRKAKRMISMLVSRAKTLNDLEDITRRIGYENARYKTWIIVLEKWKQAKEGD